MKIVSFEVNVKGHPFKTANSYSIFQNRPSRRFVNLSMQGNRSFLSSSIIKGALAFMFEFPFFISIKIIKWYGEIVEKRLFSKNRLLIKSKLNAKAATEDCRMRVQKRFFGIVSNFMTFDFGSNGAFPNS